MTVTLTPDMRAVIRSAHLCFAATVTPDGRPNLSPKGTIRVWDEGHLFFLDIASPRTRANLAVHPYAEINVVETLSRRGYRFSGPVAVHTSGNVFAKAVEMVLLEEGTTFEVAGVVLLEIEHAAPLVSPGYRHIRHERDMRMAWCERRSALDMEYEAFLFTHAAFWKV